MSGEHDRLALSVPYDIDIDPTAIDTLRQPPPVPSL
ncbi:hypothetical protein EDD93_2149 [Streptomyces sp. 840.1]|nr:hypothetical protein EDD93_2149 [Streptomyces sp. 840.1]